MSPLAAATAAPAAVTVTNTTVAIPFVIVVDRRLRAHAPEAEYDACCTSPPKNRSALHGFWNTTVYCPVAAYATDVIPSERVSVVGTAPEAPDVNTSVTAPSPPCSDDWSVKNMMSPLRR